MTKIALLGDTHFGCSKASATLHNYMKKFYVLLFRYLEKHDIKHLVQAGDLYDQRKDVHFYTIQWAKENFFAEIDRLDINLTVIAGNHDCVFKNHNRLNSISLLCPDNTTIVDTEPRTVEVGGVSFDLYPWINPENLDQSLRFAADSTSKYALGHFEFGGFPMHPGAICDHGLNYKSFSKYDEVFSGHFHTLSQKDNIQFLSTPYEMSWSDCGDPKGFWILDTETGAKEFIRNPYTLFERINYVDDLTYDFSNATDKYIKINIIEKLDQKKFDIFFDNIKLNRPYDVKINEHSFTEAVAEAVDSTTLVTTNQMISNVIDNLDTSLDRAKLKNYVLEFYSEAMTINNQLEAS